MPNPKYPLTIEQLYRNSLRLWQETIKTRPSKPLPYQLHMIEQIIKVDKQYFNKTHKTLNFYTYK